MIPAVNRSSWRWRFEASGSGIRNSLWCIVVPVVLVLIVLGHGCASRDGGIKSKDYAALAEKQRAAAIPDEITRGGRLPDLTDADYERLGDNLLLSGDPVKAFLQYDRVLRSQPANVQVRCKRGRVFLARGMVDDALKDFEEAAKKDPKYAPAYEGMGQALFKKKRYDEAERAFRQALQLNDRLWLARSYLGVVYNYRGKPELAVPEHQAAITIRPEDGTLYNNLGISYSLMGNDEAAAAAFQDALARSPSDERISNNLGLTLCRLGRYVEALEAFRRSGDEARAYNNLGAALMQLGEYDRAVRAFEIAVSRRSGYYAQAAENLKQARAAVEVKGGTVASPPSGSGITISPVMVEGPVLSPPEPVLTVPQKPAVRRAPKAQRPASLSPPPEFKGLRQENADFIEEKVIPVAPGDGR